MSALATWLPPLISGIAVGVAATITAAATVKSARKAADTAKQAAEASGSALVQVARIEQQTATDGHFAKWWELEYEHGKAVAEARRLEAIENERLRAQLEACHVRERELEDDKAFLLGVLTQAGLESVIVRRMQEESQKRQAERGSDERHSEKHSEKQDTS